MSISGDPNSPTSVESTSLFYHAVLGSVTPSGINSSLFSIYPDLAYDSWVTIGLDGVPNESIGEEVVETVQSSENPWATNFEPGGGLPGGNILMEDEVGAWFVGSNASNALPDANHRILVGQFTTEGQLQGQFNLDFVQTDAEGTEVDLPITLSFE